MVTRFRPNLSYVPTGVTIFHGKMYDHMVPRVIHLPYMHVRPRWDVKGWDENALTG